MVWLEAVLLVLGALLLLRLVLFRGPARAPESLPTSPIVDMHCHCAGIGAGESGCFVSPRMQHSWKYSLYMKGFGISPRELAEKGDSCGIEKIAHQVASSRHVDAAVILAMDAVVDESGEVDRERTIFYIPNRFVARETHPYRHLYFGASVHPFRRDALERLRWCREQGAVLVKWLPSIQYIDPSDRRLESFYRELIDLDLPLLSHAGDERSFTEAVDELADPLRLELPLQMGVRVIAAHIGSTGKNEGQDNMERTLGLMDEYSNLWADVSALTQVNRKHFLSRALETPRIHDRLLYGTDHPLTDMPVVSAYFFPLRLRLNRMRSLSRIGNPWDRDVALKQSLGLPAEVFAEPPRMLGLEKMSNLSAD